MHLNAQDTRYGLTFSGAIRSTPGLQHFSVEKNQGNFRIYTGLVGSAEAGPSSHFGAGYRFKNAGFNIKKSEKLDWLPFIGVGRMYLGGNKSSFDVNPDKRIYSTYVIKSNSYNTFSMGIEKTLLTPSSDIMRVFFEVKYIHSNTKVYPTLVEGQAYDIAEKILTNIYKNGFAYGVGLTFELPYNDERNLVEYSISELGKKVLGRFKKKQ